MPQQEWELPCPKCGHPITVSNDGYPGSVDCYECDTEILVHWSPSLDDTTEEQP